MGRLGALGWDIQGHNELGWRALKIHEVNVASINFKMEDVWETKMDQFLAMLRLDDPKAYEKREPRFSMKVLRSVTSLDLHVDERTSGTLPQSYLQSIALAIVIEGILENLDILKSVNRLPPMELDISNKQLHERIENMGIQFHVLDPAISALERERTAGFAKLNRDLTFIEEVLKETYTNLVEQNVHLQFLDRVREYMGRFREEEETLKTNSVRRKEIKTLQKSIDSERRCSETNIDRATTILGNLKDELEVRS